MIREAVQGDMDSILELYLFLYEDRIPEEDEYLRDIWMQIIQDPNQVYLPEPYDKGPGAGNI